MKILVLIPFSFYQPSGSSFNTYYRVKALVELGFDITVLTYPHGEDLNNIKIIRYPKKKIFKTLQPGEYKKKIIYDLFLFLGILMNVVKMKYDIIIAHGTMYYWGVLTMPFTRSIFIATLHGSTDGEFEKWGLTKNKLIKKILKKIDIFVLRNYDKLIVVAESIKTHLRNDNLPDKKFYVINNSVPSKTIEIKKQDAEKEGFIILYTGTFVKIQNLDLIYNTAPLLQKENIKFILIGGTEKELIENQKIIDRRNLKKVELVPRVIQENLEKYYNECDIVISPRVYGNEIPMKLYDYMNYGKCILAADMPIHHQLLNKENAFLFKPTPEKLAEAIIYLKKNNEIVDKLGKQAKDDFEANFSFEMMKEKYSNLLNNLLNDIKF